jgi:trehalose-phosphatase
MVHLFKELDTLRKRLNDSRIMLFLDYDGTVTPIVERPELAVLSLKTRQVLQKLAQKKHVHLFIVSGRSMANVKQLAAIDNIVYMGNHGLEIEGANIGFEDFCFAQFREILEYLKWEIAKELVFFKGAFVEDKGLGLSVHYRLLNLKDEAIFKTFLGVITWEFSSKGKIRITPGKKVFEIRASIDWDKGKAVSWILEKEQSAYRGQEILPIYIGDDTTDEDAFLAIKNRGITVCVGNSESLHAQYYLNHTDEVVQFLEHLEET